MLIPRVLFLVGACLLVGGIAFWTLARKTQVSTSYTPEQQKTIDQSVDFIVSEFERWRTYAPQVREGQVIPILPFSVFPNHKQPDWNKPMLLTFGSEYASIVKELYKEKANQKLQFVHVIYRQDWEEPSGDLNAEKLSEFDKNITLLDAYNKNSETNTALKSLGIVTGGYAFILNEKHNIIYSSNNFGLNFTELVSKVNDFSQKKLVSNSSIILDVNKSLPFPNLLPNSIKNAIKKEISKPWSLIILKSSSECKSCGISFDAANKPILQELKKFGFGIVIIDVNQSKYSIEFSEVGILKIQDSLIPPNRPSLFIKEWNIRGYPEMRLLRDGKNMGSIPYRSWNFTNGSKSENLQVLAVKKIYEQYRSKR